MRRGRPKNETYPRKRFAERASALCSQQDVSVHKLAARVGIDPGTTGGILHGTRNCEVERRRKILMELDADPEDYRDFLCGPPPGLTFAGVRYRTEIDRGRDLLGRSHFAEAERVFDGIEKSVGVDHLTLAHVAWLRAWIFFERDEFLSAERQIFNSVSLISVATGTAVHNSARAPQKLDFWRTLEDLASDCSVNSRETWVLNWVTHVLGKILVARFLSENLVFPALPGIPRLRRDPARERMISSALQLHLRLAEYLGDLHHQAHILLWQATFEAHRLNDQAATRAIDQARGLQLKELGRAYLARADGIANTFIDRSASAAVCLRDAADRFSEKGDARALGPTLMQMSRLQRQHDPALRYALAAAAAHPYGSIRRNFANVARKMIENRGITGSRLKMEIDKIINIRAYPFDLVYNAFGRCGYADPEAALRLNLSSLYPLTLNRVKHIEK